MTAPAGLLAAYCRREGLDERRVREGLAEAQARDRLRLREAVARDERRPVRPPRPRRRRPPAARLLTLLRAALRDRREELHALLAQALAAELEAIAKGVVRRQHGRA